MSHEFAGGDSSNIHWARFDPDKQTLQVDFRGKDGSKTSTYEYTGFNDRDWLAFQRAQSKGLHFATKIRGKFSHTKIWSK